MSVQPARRRTLVTPQSPIAGPPAAPRPKASEPSLTDGHEPVLRADDMFFGGFCVLMLATAAVGWWRHEISPRGPLVVAAFLVTNVIISQISFRAKNPFPVEVLRAVAGAVIAPAAYLLLDGPLTAFWPGFLIMCLGGCVTLGVITQSPLWGRLLVVYYLTLFVLATVFGIRHPNWYEVLVNGGVIAMVGLLWATIMSLLGRTLKNERERTIELQQARDALLAEIEIAHQIQTLLLPRDPQLPGNLVSGRMLPATEVGGDYYDVIEMGSRRAFLAIGDVSGHGVTSGLTMMMARSSLLGVIEANPGAPLADIYGALNRCLWVNLERMGVKMYMTFALIEYLGAGKFRAVGRHLPLLVYRRAAQQVEEIELEGMWLGVLNELTPDRLPVADFALAHGDLLVLYTDGIVEHTAGREMFGFDRLRDLVRGNAAHGPTHLIDAVMTDLERFSTVREDDMTMLVIDHRGEVVGAKAPDPVAAAGSPAKRPDTGLPGSVIR